MPSITWIDDFGYANRIGDPPFHILRAIVRACPLAWVTA